MSGDIFGDHNYCYLMVGGLGCCEVSYSAQNRPHSKVFPAPNVNRLRRCALECVSLEVTSYLYLFISSTRPTEVSNTVLGISKQTD